MKEEKKSKLAQSILESVTNKVPLSILTKVITDWQEYFNELTRYKSGQKLLKVVGPVAYGIELEKFLSDKYRPRVILINLIDGSSTFIKVIDQTIKNNRDLDISIGYSQHSKEYIETCKLLEQQSRISLFGKPTIEDIIKSIITYIEKDSIGNCFWSCQAVMQLSRLVEDEVKKELFFSKGLELLKKKIPVQLLDIQTKGTEKWISGIRDLDVKKISELIEISIRNKKLQSILKDAVDKI